MNKSLCPNCGVRLGNFRYADACPYCHQELAHNTRPLIGVPPHDPNRKAAWPVRLMSTIRRIVES